MPPGARRCRAATRALGEGSNRGCKKRGRDQHGHGENGPCAKPVVHHLRSFPAFDVTTERTTTTLRCEYAPKHHVAQLFCRPLHHARGPSIDTLPGSRHHPHVRPLLACGVLLASVVSAAAPPPATLTVGVLRRDAIIVPFATYDGKRWESHWPQPSQGVDVPISLHSVPGRWWGASGPVDAWQIWTDAAPPRLVHVRQPDWLQSYCQKQVGLRTNYQPKQRPPGAEAQPYPKDGLALWPPH